MAGMKTVHLLARVMDSAAVAKKHLCHGGLTVKVNSMSAEWREMVAG
jgi:hypothetical protein